MIVYLDLLVASTAIVNYSLLKTISVALKVHITKRRMLLAVIFSVLLLASFYLPSLGWCILRYTGGLFIGLIAFKGNWQKKTLFIGLYYFLNLAFVGTLVVFNIRNLLMLALSLFFIIILFIIANFTSRFGKYQKWQCQVRIGKHYLEGLYDTGNETLYADYPVVFLQTRYHDDQFNYAGRTQIQSIQGTMDVACFSGPLLEYDNQKQKVYYVFSNQMNYDVILNHFLKEE